MSLQSLSTLFRAFLVMRDPVEKLKRDNYLFPVSLLEKAVEDIVTEDGETLTSAKWQQIADWIEKSAKSSSCAEDRRQLESLANTMFVIADSIKHNIYNTDIAIEKTLMGELWHFQPLLAETEKHLRLTSRRWFTTQDNVAHMIPREEKTCRFHDDARSYFDSHRDELRDAQEQKKTIAYIIPPTEKIIRHIESNQRRIDAAKPPVKTNADAVFVSDPASAVRHFYSWLSKFFRENPQIGEDYRQKAIENEQRRLIHPEGIPLNLG